MTFKNSVYSWLYGHGQWLINLGRWPRSINHWPGPYLKVNNCILLNDKEFCFLLIGLNSIFSTLPQNEYTSRAVSIPHVQWVYLACSEYTSREVYSGLSIFVYFLFGVSTLSNQRRDFISSRPIKWKKRSKFSKISKFNFFSKKSKFSLNFKTFKNLIRFQNFHHISKF